MGNTINLDSYLELSQNYIETFTNLQQKLTWLNILIKKDSRFNEKFLEHKEGIFATPSIKKIVNQMTEFCINNLNILKSSELLLNKLILDTVPEHERKTGYFKKILLNTQSKKAKDEDLETKVNSLNKKEPIREETEKVYIKELNKHESINFEEISHHTGNFFFNTKEIYAFDIFDDIIYFTDFFQNIYQVKNGKKTLLLELNIGKFILLYFRCLYRNFALP